MKQHTSVHGWLSTPRDGEKSLIDERYDALRPLPIS
jgi:hypothetical protein